MDPGEVMSRACYYCLLGKLAEAADQLEIVFEMDEEGYFVELSEDNEDLSALKNRLLQV